MYFIVLPTVRPLMEFSDYSVSFAPNAMPIGRSPKMTHLRFGTASSLYCKLTYFLLIRSKVRVDDLLSVLESTHTAAILYFLYYYLIDAALNPKKLTKTIW